ncbi:hypothetical protein NCAS_0I02960 [Naumovozyma castellii]|uniref:Prefoldin subunit 1 n=1 Tax=Naumovozyma castellii TaxID=27288 RepID=G0VKD0_NAUCA|nr:hypothetical protein NCAS_0I02960 [Naumovozyma castellii CBS 4309]CCC71964.1 hypothetical protein NCAS_0I02960 [Naumovozyma castellii CBS 4309]
MSANKLAQEMATSLRTSKGQLDLVNQQLTHLSRQETIAQVTAKELESYPTSKVWRSCGKTFILQDKSDYISDLTHDEKLLQEQKKALEIKQKYLTTTVENTAESLKRLIQRN